MEELKEVLLECGGEGEVWKMKLEEDLISHLKKLSLYFRDNRKSWKNF